MADLLPKPMKGDEPELGHKLRFPLHATTKIDGIRCMLHPHPNKTVKTALPFSASLKPIRNKHISKMLSELQPGHDGELGVVNPETGVVDFLNSTSAVMSFDGTPKFKFFIFDNWMHQGGYLKRVDALLKLNLPDWCEVLIPQQVNSQDDVDELFKKVRLDGHEGLILRDGDGKYKHGRSTVREQLMIKVKPWRTSEGRVKRVEEELHNGNAAEKNELGRTKRSSAKAGLTGKGRVGSLILVDPKLWNGAEFSAGGLTDAQKEQYWANPPIGELWTYKYLETGGKDLPRHPGLIGPRHEDDMTDD